MKFFKYVAIQCMQGILANGTHPSVACKEAIKSANFLIEKMAAEKAKA